MKFLTPLLCLLFAQGIAIAEEPAELSERRQAWEKERTEAQTKVDELYFNELEELKKNFTQADNIAAALAVDNVIKGRENADNEPEALNKIWGARDSSLKKALTPIDKQYWQDLKKLRVDFRQQGKLDGVVAADAEIEKVLVAYKKSAEPTSHRNTSYLSDLQEFDVRVGHGSFGKKGELGWHGEKIVVNGKPSQEGLSIHPPTRGSSSVSYNLNGKYRWLLTRPAINDTSKGSVTPVTFRILGDGKLLWTSKPIQHGADIKEVKVDVRSVQKLQLEVNCPGPYTYAHAVWIDPQLLW